MGQLTRRTLTDRRLTELKLETPSATVETNYVVDPYGNVTEETSGRGAKTVYDYAGNAHRYPARVSRGHLAREFRYDLGHGGLLEYTVPRSLDPSVPPRKTTHEYDAFGRLKSIQYDSEPDPAVSVSYELTAQPRYMEVERKLGHNRVRKEREYVDGLGRVKAKVAGNGSTWIASGLTEYDADGRVHKVYEPFSSSSGSFTPSGADLATTYRYVDDKVADVVYPDGAATGNWYTADGVIFMDEKGIVSFERFDAFDQLVEFSTDRSIAFGGFQKGSRPTSGTTRYEYDGLGGLRLVEDARGLKTDYLYDARGLLRGLTSPDGRESLRNGYRVWSDYDANANQTFAWSGSDVLRYQYDELDRQTFFHVSRDGGTSFYGESEFQYDLGTEGLGQLTRVTGHGAPLTWSEIAYDPRGRVRRETFHFENLASALANRTIEYEYDRESRLTAIKDPLDRWLRYQRNVFGQIQGHENAVSFAGRPAVKGMTYDPSGRLTSVRYGHDIADHYEYDDRGRMVTIRGDLDGGPLQVVYLYDRAGNVELEQHYARDFWVGYKYDNRHRVTGADGTIASRKVSLEYDYDIGGNLLSVTGQGALDFQRNPVSSTTYGYEAGTNRVSALHFDDRALDLGYDQHGNLTTLFSARYGAITIIQSKSAAGNKATGSTSGYHVAFFVSATENRIRLLGGNQSDSVKFSNFKLSSYNLVGYRWPK